ncbi:hypothetical protein M5K25_023728 [Dendrobium thyrsiflorum]|uniref:Uncharacterized protein n=1 Tax=Dendrobium thyrsiflorum TaxID=117978 RepID=A0ABD0U041_DENTH
MFNTRDTSTLMMAGTRYYNNIRRIYGISPKKRAKGRKLSSQRASSRRCFRSKCRNFRSDRKGPSSKEPKKRLVQSLHLCEATKLNSDNKKQTLDASNLTYY